MNRMLIASAVLALVAGVASAQTKQTQCPVMHEALGSKPISVAYTGKSKEFKGKSILVCCGGCVGMVKKDPDTFFKAALGKK